jgi:superfamily I DNA/RNA helicase
MGLNYFYFGKGFIYYFMQYSQFHNADFEQGKDFLSCLQNYEDGKIKYIDKIRIVNLFNGVYVLEKEEKELQGFVFDLKNSSDENFIIDNILQIIEKLFSFYIKIDKNYPRSNNEFHIANTDVYFINPFGLCANDYFKIFVSILPGKTRDIKRNTKLFLNIGDGKGKIHYENYNKANYRQVIDSFPKVLEKISSESLVMVDDKKYEYQLQGKLNNADIFDLTYVSKNLTLPQKNFINNDNLGPTKLVGPAGTGKTASLLLKSLFIAKSYESKQESLSICFVCHSEAMKDSIITRLGIMQDGGKYLKNNYGVVIKAYSLLDWCIKFAVTNFDESKCLEVDSADAKLMQEMQINAAIKKFKDEDFSTFKPLLSKEFEVFIKKTNDNILVRLIQNEISIFIKGNNIQSFEDYKVKAKRDKLLPWQNEIDLGAIYSIYEKYQQALFDINKYDLDDVTNVALSYLKQGIWKRERENFGFDVLFVDELHLFDFHELNIIKYMLKKQEANHIIYATDVAQSLGDIDIIQNNINSVADENLTDENLNIIFRCSKEIMGLVSFLFDSKMHLFTNINPMANAIILETDENDKKPELIETINDELLIQKVLEDKLLKTQDRSKVLNVFTDLDLLDKFKNYMSQNNILFITITKRNELESVIKAQRESKIILSYIDYIGGLEFDYVNIIGFDKNRVPPKDNALSKDFFEHIWYRKIYVAFTRARHELKIYTNTESGKHTFLQESLKQKYLTKKENLV